MDDPETTGVHLVRTRERVDEVSALAAALGGRVGVAGVLDDLNRKGSVRNVPGRAVRWGFRWDDEDSRSQRWWPQGITTSADADPATEQVAGRAVLCTSWYSKDVDGLNKGSRVTFVDVGASGGPAYRHVLLVEAHLSASGTVDLRPVKVHAGGLVWHGRYLHAAGTARGIHTFHLDDVMRVPGSGDPSALGVGVGSFGYRYVLPVRFTYDAFAEDGVERMRYSFLSLAHAAGGGGPAGAPRLVAGEYGRGSRTTRLVDFTLDPATSLLRVSDDGVARPSRLPEQGVQGMQGATVAGGRWYLTTSAGRCLPGSLYVGRPGAFRRRTGVLPVGVEDVSYWPSRDQLLSLSEYPGRRYVFAMDRSTFD